MLELENWAEGRFKPMAMLGQLAAISAKDCYVTVVKAREHATSMD